MTELAIKEQIEAIERATKKALKSKQASYKFLVDAGIIEIENKKEKKKAKPVSKKKQ